MLILNKRYTVSDIDKYGKLYNNVSRAYLISEDDKNLVLDYHSVLLKLSSDDILNIQIFDSFEEEVKCDYQMNGTIYKIEDGDLVKVYASFGGLLMILDVEGNEIQELNNRSKISLLISKI